MRYTQAQPTEQPAAGNRPDVPPPPEKAAPRDCTGGRILRWAGAVALLLAVLAAGVALLWLNRGKKGEDTVQVDASGVKPVPGQPGTILVPEDAVRGLGIRTAPARPAKDLRPINMYGQLAPNLDRLIRLKPKFSGKVIAIPPVPDIDKDGRSIQRPLTQNVYVGPNQLLCVIVSTDLGQTKSTYVDSWSQYLADTRALDQLKANSQDIPLRTLQDKQRDVDKDRIAANTAANTLRSWGLTEDDLKELREEAKKGGTHNSEQFERWARYELRAPKNWGGIIVEKNATEGENIDPTNGPPLFQVADYSTLWVYAYPYEEDLPTLRGIQQSGPIRWTIVPKAEPGTKLSGTVDVILPVIDPYMKTPILRGHVANPGERLLSQMSVTCTVQVSAPPDEVAIPATALLDVGDESVVFVQPDPDKGVYRLQYVDVVRRYETEVFVRSKLSPRERKEAAENGTRRKPLPLKAGQLVVTSGAIALNAELEDVQSQGAKQ
jgi:multidrug efflux pump subunit AcrA (membrane-fusion protein)